MNLAIWIVSGLVAFAMFAAGGMKLATPRLKLAEKMKWAASWTDTNVKLLGHRHPRDSTDFKLSSE